MPTTQTDSKLKDFYILNNLSDEELTDLLYSLQDNNETQAINEKFNSKQ